jgi:CheY-like chemotaxis protein
VANGLEVLEALKLRDYDLILLDIQMPEMDGYSVARELSRIYDREQIPWMIAMTANALEGDRDRCLQAGMDDYLSKPVRKEELDACLKRSFQALRIRRDRS